MQVLKPRAIKRCRLCVCGHLALHNPAYVMPSLRKFLIQLLTELEYLTVMGNREDCTRLLTLLVSTTQRLLKPYTLPMLLTSTGFAV